MRRKQNQVLFAYYAKILFVISIAFLSYGCFLQFFGNTKFSNHEVIQKPDEGIVSVTPAGDSVVPSENDNSPSSPENRMQDGSTVIIDTPSIEEANDILRNEIQSMFGVTVLYGEETKGYTVMSDGNLIGIVPIMDPYVVNNQLLSLKNVLNMYPVGIFKEIRDGGIPLTVILISQYSDRRVTGITDSSYSYAKISIAAIYSFEESFYHESYHYIERYLFKKGANFNSWDTFNPSDFRWGTIHNDLAYNTTFSESAPFVNTYAQTSAPEDRASTFEYMMASSKASCLNSGTIVWSKADYMSRMIRYVLKTVQDLSHSKVKWEQYLY